MIANIPGTQLQNYLKFRKDPLEFLYRTLFFAFKLLFDRLLKGHFFLGHGTSSFFIIHSYYTTF